MTADLLVALERLLDDMDHEANSHYIGLPWYGQDRYEARAAIAAHKEAHRNVRGFESDSRTGACVNCGEPSTQHDCPSLALSGYKAGHEAERKH